MILTVKTTQKTEMIDITSQVVEAMSRADITEGICMLFVPHTTAAVTINENADPDVKTDILMILNQIVPWQAGYRHVEGNSPAHVKSSLVGASQLIPVQGKRLVLGTWQGLFFCEFDGPRTRKVHINFLE
jgi:secondary thiamine-phosphate synthase enzyme